eukprot:5442276-Lingulodinium_polyedra.AAC.1
MHRGRGHGGRTPPLRARRYRMHACQAATSQHTDAQHFCSSCWAMPTHRSSHNLRSGGRSNTQCLHSAARA